MGDGLLSLCWNNHRSTFCHCISTLRQKERYSDVTLACEGRFYPVHKLVLSVCSEYFDAMLDRTPCKHPIIVLRDVQPTDLEALLSYMYEGIVSVSQNDLGRLIKTAEMLKIKGLAVADVDDSMVTADGRRLTSLTTTTIPLVGSVVRSAQEGRASPQPKKRRRNENGVANIQIANSYSTTGVDNVTTSSANEFEGRPRQRTELHREHVVAKQEVQHTEQIVVQEGLVTEEATIDDQKSTATIIGTYGVVVSDGGAHTLVSHPQDPNQVITHRYETAQLTGAQSQQPLAEAVAEALAGPSGMQTWLGSTDLGSTSFTTVEAYTTDNVQGTTIQNLENAQTTSGPAQTASGVVNAVSAPGVVVETVQTPTTGASSTPTRGEGGALKCNYCNRATFRQSSDLKRHIRIHTGEKPFKCSFCPYKASRKDLLQAHTTKLHNVSNSSNQPKEEPKFQVHLT